MPMIDVYAAAGTFNDRKSLARDLAAAVMRWEGVPDISLFKDNTCGFVHELPPDAISDVAGSGRHIRVQGLTPASVLDGDKQLGVGARPSPSPAPDSRSSPVSGLRIAILDDYQDVARSFADWDSLSAQMEVFTAPFSDADEVVQRLAGFDVLVAMRERTSFPADVLSRLKSLKLLVTTGPGNAAIDVKAARELGIVVCGTGYYSFPSAELTWALILAAARNLPEQLQSMRNGGWQRGIGTSVQGLTLGLLGLGTVGKLVAAFGQAFSMRVIAWSPNLTREKAAEHGVTAVSKEQLFSDSDILSIHIVLSERSRGLVGASALGLMKPTSI